MVLVLAAAIMLGGLVLVANVQMSNNRSFTQRVLVQASTGIRQVYRFAPSFSAALEYDLIRTGAMDPNMISASGLYIWLPYRGHLEVNVNVNNDQRFDVQITWPIEAGEKARALCRRIAAADKGSGALGVDYFLEVLIPPAVSGVETEVINTRCHGNSVSAAILGVTYAR